MVFNPTAPFTLLTCGNVNFVDRRCEEWSGVERWWLLIAGGKYGGVRLTGEIPVLEW